jgi:hypothetical protein
MEPLEEIIDKYAKKECPTNLWIQIYHLTNCYCLNEMGFEDFYYDSEEIYIYPYTSNFTNFVEEEYIKIIAEPNHITKYNKELKQSPEIMETLLVIKQNHTYTFRCFPVSEIIPKENQVIKYDPKESSVEFIFVEYTHPKMYSGIVFDIPKEYFLVGNQLFSPSFIQRYLELQKKHYYFDEDYKLVFVDHLCDKYTIESNQYIEILEDSYVVKELHVTNETISLDNPENESDNSDNILVNMDELDYLGDIIKTPKSDACTDTSLEKDSSIYVNCDSNSDSKTDPNIDTDSDLESEYDHEPNGLVSYVFQLFGWYLKED